MKNTIAPTSKHYILILLFSLPIFLSAQKFSHEIGLTTFRLNLSPGISTPTPFVFNPSLRYQFHFKHFGFRLNYAMTRIDIRYPDRYSDNCQLGYSHEFDAGLQLRWQIRRFQIYTFVDAGIYQDDYLLSFGCGQGHPVKRMGQALKPGVGLKFRLFNDFWLGTEVYYRHRRGETDIQNGTLYPYTDKDILFSGLICSWRF